MLEKEMNSFVDHAGTLNLYESAPNMVYFMEGVQ